MGFEYTIKLKLDNRQTNEVNDLLININSFDKKYEFNSKTFWDFRLSDNFSTIPDTSLTLDNDGIYICQNISSYIWAELEILKSYFEKNYIEYEVIES